jgi:arylsulfatase A-like enzyme
VIILSAKHGQSPQEPGALTRIPDGPIIDALNAAWVAAGHSGNLVTFSIDDDAMVVWLSDHSDAAETFATSFLLGHNGTGNDITGAPKPYTASGLATVYAGRDAARFFGVRPGDARVPDLYGVVQHGVVYTGGTGKIAEHGGADPQDRNVPLVVAGRALEARQSMRKVETTQIAPTILDLLGLDSNQLKAVRIEHTRSLPLG